MHYFDRLWLVERTPAEVDRDTRLLVQNTVALAEMLHRSRSESLGQFAGKEIYSNVKADLKLARIDGLEILAAGSEGTGIDQ